MIDETIQGRVDSDSSMGSDTDTSDDERAELDVEEEDLEELLKLDAKLQQNPRSYRQNVKYINLLEKNKLKNKLHAARKRMHEFFPLPEDLWTSWLNDELEAVEDADGLRAVMDLCSAAVKDYLSVSLWKFMLQIEKDLDPVVQAGDDEGKAKFRQACEEAVNTAGLHFLEGQQIWDVYRAWEEAVLTEHPDDKAQQERVRKLFHRNLTVPLQDLQQVMEQYQEWESSKQQAVPLHVKKVFEKAQEAAHLRQIYEKTITTDKTADAELLAAYLSYIKLEAESGDVARVQCMYERAICVFPTCNGLWLQYLHYLESHGTAAEVLSSVAHRAARNCHRAGSVWALYLSVLELAEADDDDHQAAYASALDAGVKTNEELLSVILARAAYLRRNETQPQVHRLFYEAAQQLLEARADATAASVQLAAAWALCEANTLEDVEAARRVWERAVAGPGGRLGAAWLGYIALEHSLRNMEHVRQLYVRALEQKLDRACLLELSQQWVDFERAEGSAEQQGIARVAAGAFLEEPTLQAARPPAEVHAVASTAAAAPKTKKRKQPEHKGEAAARAKGQDDPADGAGQKRQRGGDFPDENALSKKLKAWEDEGGTAPDTGTPLKHINQGDNVTEGRDTDMQDAVQGAKKGRPTAGPPKVVYTDQQTVYVRNLGDAVTENELRELFKGCGHIRDVRIPKDQQGVPKGFAYIELGSEEHVAAAEQLHGKEFKGQLLFVKKSDPPKSGLAGRGRGRGGPFKPGGTGGHTGDEHCRPTGGRGPGRGRGESGSRPGEQHHRPMGGRGPGRGRGEGGRLAQSSSAIPTTREPVATPKRHLELTAPAPFMPRSVQQPKGGAGQEKPGGSGTEAAGAKTNADFRKMLLEGKLN